ncbi:MAG: hypothetical protein GWN79_01460, partial [Actinobacteria bacterium]|nr:hypothetical protein [Gemmatimonadota bacterium]NIU17837.1 hypothetical protein [Actinomycetota bacterium]NIU79097.1 hypothetical protein [Gammaproteobacteria bacterium]NIX44785.1 hypothetical protein [Gemmatimonadota bacterium]NIY12171.1 hypothetical protein [Gemmatimonadota bacterium]
MPAYHYLLFALVLAVVIWSVIRLVEDPSLDRVMVVLLAVVLVLTAFYARAFPLRVQDRVIRLEERLRMETLLPDDLRSRIGEFTTGQLIGLRFASDEELPELARKVLDEGLTDRKSIKQAVKNWRA